MKKGLRVTADKVIEVKAGLTESKATHSLSQISQNEIEKNEVGVTMVMTMMGRIVVVTRRMMKRSLVKGPQ